MKNTTDNNPTNNVSELENNNARFQDLFDNVSDIIQCIAPDGTFLYANRAWYTTLGYSEEELVSMNIFDIIHPDCSDHCIGLFTEVMQGQDIGRFETDFIAKDGRKITVEGSVNCRFENGKPVNTRAIFRDITERKKLEAEKDALIQQLQASLEKVKLLNGLIPICASCKKVRDDKGYWNDVELYVRKHSDAEFSHGICPDCIAKLYPEFTKKKHHKS
ncbi:MAG: PAS domain S-box protein [Candidatus Marinimicrobia bacterium]|nr:PAS domain S-box protein [Candidatus Neomarinimicrobiota bacterium]